MDFAIKLYQDILQITMPTIEEKYEIEIITEEPNQNQPKPEMVNKISEKNLSDLENKKDLKKWLKFRQHDRLAHVSTSKSSSIENLLSKSKNINCTLLVDDIPINTYADDDWKGNAGIIFKTSSSLWLGFFDNDIGSNEYKGFYKNGKIEPKIMFELADWRKSLSTKKVSHSFKKTQDSAVKKLIENSQKRLNHEIDHSSTIYYTVDKKLIYTGLNKKLSNSKAGITNRGNVIPTNHLNHNEVHIRANLNDIEGVFITKNDWDSNTKTALSSLKSLFNRISKLKHYNKPKPSLDSNLLEKLSSNFFKNKNLLESNISEIKNDIAEKISYYEKLIDLLNNKKNKYKEDFECLNKSKEIINDDLTEAFTRKKKKVANFDENSIINKKIWLKKHYSELKRDCEELKLVIDYLKTEILDENIKKNFENDLKIYVYDASKGLCEQITQQDFDEKTKNIACLDLLAKSYKISLSEILFSNESYFDIASKISLGLSLLWNILIMDLTKRTLDNYFPFYVSNTAAASMFGIHTIVFANSISKFFKWLPNNDCLTIQNTSKFIGWGVVGAFCEIESHKQIKNEIKRMSDDGAHMLAATYVLLGICLLNNYILPLIALSYDKSKDAIKQLKQISIKFNQLLTTQNNDNSQSTNDLESQSQNTLLSETEISQNININNPINGQITYKENNQILTNKSSNQELKKETKPKDYNHQLGLANKYINNIMKKPNVENSKRDLKINISDLKNDKINETNLVINYQENPKPKNSITKDSQNEISVQPILKVLAKKIER